MMAINHKHESATKAKMYGNIVNESRRDSVLFVGNHRSIGRDARELFDCHS